MLWSVRRRILAPHSTLLTGRYMNPLMTIGGEESETVSAGTDLTIVICGEHTHTAKGVAAELTISREEGKSYFLLWGRPHENCTKPAMALKSDKVYKWTWENLKQLISGAR